MTTMGNRKRGWPGGGVGVVIHGIFPQSCPFPPGRAPESARASSLPTLYQLPNNIAVEPEDQACDCLTPYHFSAGSYVNGGVRHWARRFHAPLPENRNVELCIVGEY